MMMIEKINAIVIVIISVIVFVCSLGIVLATKFQRKQKQKYNDCLNIIKEKENSTFQVKNGLSKEEIEKIDSNVNVDKLMSDLYNSYLSLQEKLKNMDSNFDDLLTGYVKEFYINKIESLNQKGYRDVTDGIDLINYSITEFSKEKLKFRITINCFEYKLLNDKIVSGSNLEKKEQISIITYEKVNNEWLISNIEKVLERKLSN